MELHAIPWVNGPACFEISPRAAKHLGLDPYDIRLGTIGDKERIIASHCR